MDPLDLNLSNYSALIFDCDGTLVDTVHLHFQSFQRALAAQGFAFDEAWYRNRLGISRRLLFLEFEREYKIALDHEAAIRMSQAVFATLVNQVQESRFAASIARLHYGRMPMAVASGGQRVVVEATLRACRLFDLFDVIVTFEDVNVGKPAPDLFLEAARRLTISPSSCLVFEDSDEGIDAAACAGMAAVDVRVAIGRVL